MSDFKDDFSGPNDHWGWGSAGSTVYEVKQTTLNQGTVTCFSTPSRKEALEYMKYSAEFYGGQWQIVWTVYDKQGHAKGHCQYRYLPEYNKHPIPPYWVDVHFVQPTTKPDKL